LWLAETWGITDSPLAERAVALGVASRVELAACTEAWHNWATHPDGWFVVVHGEVAVPRSLFAEILRRIDHLRQAPPLPA
jgi:hypothetical protein